LLPKTSADSKIKKTRFITNMKLFIHWSHHHHHHHQIIPSTTSMISLCIRSK
jgi:hypothetical protein